MLIKHFFRAIFLLSLFFTCTALRAQDYRSGYVIKSNADSIGGLVRYGNKRNERHCEFKQSKKSSSITFNPSDLRAYGFSDGTRFVSIVPPGAKERVFARLVVNGPLKLYQYDKTFYVETDSMMMLPSPKGKSVDPIEKGGNKMEQKDKRYVAVLNQLLVDCQMKADDAAYSESDLTTLVRNYNRCKGFPETYKKTKPLYRVNFGALTGYVKSDLMVKEAAIVPFSVEHTTIDPSKTVIGGISFDLSSPRAYDKLFLTVESWYFNSTYLGRDYRGTMYQDITIDVTAIRLFLGLRFNFMNEASTPYIKAGISPTISQDFELKSVIENENSIGQTFYYDDVEGQMFVKKARGYWFAAGYSRVITGKMKAFLEFRYERADGYFGTAVTPDSKLNNLSFLLGIRF